MTRPGMKFSVFLSLFFVLNVSVFAVTEKKPNILYILADDMGYADISVQGGQQYQTPNIDAVFNSGVRFTNGYVTNSVCAPSRAGLLTGRMGSHFGFEANLPNESRRSDSTIGLDPAQQTIADVLKPLGYKTYCVGKWHLGYNVDLFHPNHRGFDEFVGLLGGSRSYFKIDYDVGNSLQHNGTYIDEPEDIYVTDYLTDRAIDLIHDQHENAPDQPFFIYMSYTAPHGPMHAKESDLERVSHIEKERRRIYAAMVLCLDDNVGRLQDCLDELGISDNTIVVFMSDNGGPLHNGSYNGPLKGKKGQLWEGGIRVPFGMKWAGVIPPGQVSDTVVSSVDLLPTFVAAAGADGSEPIVTDGLNLLPLLTGAVEALPMRNLFWRRGEKRNIAARFQNYKYAKERVSGQVFLFDLENDMSERNNLANSNPEILQMMQKIQTEWEVTVPDPAFSSSWKGKKK